VRAQTHGAAWCRTTDLQRGMFARKLNRVSVGRAPQSPELAARRASKGKVSPPRAMKSHGLHRFSHIEGVRLHWTELGESDCKPRLVLVHGLKDSYRTWKRLACPLAVDRRVLLASLPGHGLSGRLDARYELYWFAQVIAQCTGLPIGTNWI
jgi:hypothetical protein